MRRLQFPRRIPRTTPTPLLRQVPAEDGTTKDTRQRSREMTTPVHRTPRASMSYRATTGGRTSVIRGHGGGSWMRRPRGGNPSRNRTRTVGRRKRGQGDAERIRGGHLPRNPALHNPSLRVPTRSRARLTKRLRAGSRAHISRWRTTHGITKSSSKPLFPTGGIPTGRSQDRGIRTLWMRCRHPRPAGQTKG